MITEGEADQAGHTARLEGKPRTANPFTDAARGYAFNEVRQQHVLRRDAWNAGWVRADLEQKGWVMD